MSGKHEQHQSDGSTKYSIHPLHWLKDEVPWPDGRKPQIRLGPASFGWDTLVDALDAARSGAHAPEGFDIIIPPPPAAPVVATVETPAPPPPPDPTEVLEKIVNAINQAETILNKQNLVIATGSVQASLSVNVGGVAAGQATIQITIQPKPYN